MPHTNFTVQWCCQFKSVTCWHQKDRRSRLKHVDGSCLTHFLPLPLIGRSTRSSLTWDAWSRQTSSLCTVSNYLWRPESFLWPHGANGLGFLSAFLPQGLTIQRGMSCVVRAQKTLWHTHWFPWLCPLESVSLILHYPSTQPDRALWECKFFPPSVLI